MDLYPRARRILGTWLPSLALRLPGLDRAELGLIGEELAARALARMGWRVLARRVRTPCGEVDLLVERGPERAAVEVKAARLPAGLDPAAQRFPPGARVDDRRLARLRRAARYLGLRDARVDLFEVVVSADGRRVDLRHHPAIPRPLRPRAPRP